jgi:hypothetical protein
MGQNPTPDLRRQNGENLGTDMFQRLKICQNLARKNASQNDNEAIKNST